MLVDDLLITRKHFLAKWAALSKLLARSSRLLRTRRLSRGRRATRLNVVAAKLLHNDGNGTITTDEIGMRSVDVSKLNLNQVVDHLAGRLTVLAKKNVDRLANSIAEISEGGEVSVLKLFEELAQLVEYVVQTLH